MTDDPASPSGAITQRLLDWGTSDKPGLDPMLTVVFEELHRLATGYLSRGAPGHTLQPTVLVHERYALEGSGGNGEAGIPPGSTASCGGGTPSAPYCTGASRRLRVAGPGSS
jgi:hypothetical protein